jgi:ABC-2 type transport system ATP-binding protein
VTDAAVEVHDLTIDPGDVRAVDGASFVARRGEVTVLLGPNGAGKTSTVEHLEGFRPASGGRASVLGLDPVRDHRHLVRRVGIMLQSGGIQPAIRPRELLGQYAGFFPDPLDVDGLLRRSGLWERQRTPFRRLSGGEQQRLSLALALIGRPEVLLLDEPTAGVDLEGREQIRSTLDELRDQGATVLLTTHDLDEAERVADRLVLLHRGSVVAAGSLQELAAGRGAQLSFRCGAQLDLQALGDHLGATVRAGGRDSYQVEGTPTPALVASLTSWLADRDLVADEVRTDGGRLEDVYRRLTTDDETSAEAS